MFIYKQIFLSLCQQGGERGWSDVSLAIDKLKLGDFCIYVCIYICIYTCICMYMYVYVCTYMHEYTYICMCTYMYILIHDVSMAIDK
jgi:hypothetical protein